jgi:hypothetical protein
MGAHFIAAIIWDDRLTASADHMSTGSPFQTRAERETPVSSYTGPKFHDFAEKRSRHTDHSRAEPTAAVTKLTPGAGLLYGCITAMAAGARANADPPCGCHNCMVIARTWGCGRGKVYFDGSWRYLIST